MLHRMRERPSIDGRARYREKLVASFTERGIHLLRIAMSQNISR